MPTLDHSARTSSARGGTRPVVKPPVLRPEDFTDHDIADLSYAGTGFAVALADIATHQIGDPGFWDCYGSGPAELARLRDALDQMAASIRTARIEAARVERRARRRAVRRTRDTRSSRSGGERG